MMSLVRIYSAMAAASLLLALSWQTLFPGSTSVSAVVLYQHLFDPVDGRQCHSYPVCSDYARQAFEQFGPLLGSWLTLDRLIHEGDDLKQGPWVRVGQEVRLYDPLQRNTFWLKKGN